MRLILSLVRRARRDVLSLAALGIVTGLSSAALLAIISRVVAGGQIHNGLLAVLGAVIVIRVGSTVCSSLWLVGFAQETVLRLSRELADQVLRTPLRRIEEVGSASIMTALTDDVAALASSIMAVPTLTVNVAVLAGCGAYLAWLSPLALGILLAFGAAGAVMYRRLLRRADAANRLARQGRDELFRVFRTVTDGIKELQMHEARRTAFMRDELDRTSEFLKQQNMEAVRHHTLAQGWTQIVFYGTLVVVLLALRGSADVPRETTTAYVFAALYCTAPLWAILGVLPVFGRGTAALERLEQLGLTLTSAEAPIVTANSGPPRTPPLIEFQSVSFVYGEGGFALGPLTLTIQPGELLFIAGGNGSGKSTLVKLLTGLYAPTGGEVRVDGRPLDAASRERYRELFAVVFSDFFLFNRLHGVGAQALADSASAYLEALGLDHKVRLEQGTFSTIDLSQGQRRRLALLTAYLEDRPVYVLDEWAADQDPDFRRVFYMQLLPELKRRGKTVIVVTHDDRYFDVGDRIVKLDFGTLMSVTVPRVPKVPPPAPGGRVTAQVH